MICKSIDVCIKIDDLGGLSADQGFALEVLDRRPGEIRGVRLVPDEVVEDRALAAIRLADQGDPKDPGAGSGHVYAPFRAIAERFFAQAVQ